MTPDIGAAASDQQLLVARDVSFGYEPGTPVIHDVSLAIARGERIALVGPNGGGKSTLGRLLVGLLGPETGRVELGGRDPSRLEPAELARLAGYVFQDPEAGFLTDTVAAEVAIGLTAEEAARVPELMDAAGPAARVRSARGARIG